MYMRQTKISSRRSRDACTTFRPVASERIGGRVKQRALLNLGTNFSLPKEKWPELCTRIEQILAGQGALFPFVGDIEQEAHRYAALLIGRGGAKDRRDEHGSSFDYQEMAVNSLELVRPRPIGVEHVCLAALQELHIPQILAAPGLSKVRQDAGAVGSIISRMAGPGSELAAYGWLTGLVLDGHGFVRRAPMFAGDVCESAPLEGMLIGLQPP
jgi:hypothetical protein